MVARRVQRLGVVDVDQPVDPGGEEPTSVIAEPQVPRPRPACPGGSRSASAWPGRTRGSLPRSRTRRAARARPRTSRVLAAAVELLPVAPGPQIHPNRARLEVVLVRQPDADPPPIAHPHGPVVRSLLDGVGVARDSELPTRELPGAHLELQDVRDVLRTVRPGHLPRESVPPRRARRPRPGTRSRPSSPSGSRGATDVPIATSTRTLPVSCRSSRVCPPSQWRRHPGPRAPPDARARRR